MLYAEKGMVCRGDTYDFGIRGEHRDVVKEEFNEMV